MEAKFTNKLTDAITEIKEQQMTQIITKVAEKTPSLHVTTEIASAKRTASAKTERSLVSEHADTSDKGQMHLLAIRIDKIEAD